jgi:hypothetical protein
MDNDGTSVNNGMEISSNLENLDVPSAPLIGTLSCRPFRPSCSTLDLRSVHNLAMSLIIVKLMWLELNATTDAILHLSKISASVFCDISNTWW